MDESHKISSGTRKEWKPNFEIRFPPLPRTVAEVSRLLADSTDSPDTPRLVEIVNADPVIGASVLRRINSAYYGMRTRIADVEKACLLLGFDEVCDIVLTAGMMKLADIFESETQINIFGRIMEMSLGTAAYNKRLTQHLALGQRGFAFTTGLLYTVGRLVLLYNRPNDYEALWYSTARGKPPTVTSEQIIFGTDHTELTERTAENWKLPGDAAVVMRNYLTPGHVDDFDTRMLALTLSISASATEQFFLNGGSGEPEFSPPAALYATARQLTVAVEDLVDFLHQNRDNVRGFIQSMVHA